MDYQKLADKILEHGDRRSAAYREGMIAVIKRRIDDSPVQAPYAAGTVEFDAYFAGNERGHNEWRNALIEANGDREQAIARLQKLAGATARRAA
ncbi:hypothetical protein [Pseudomonas sp.]|uniref:hypothetical protein n=1 Tax=Pseudomonas sp. TaxID=306 RepID=UPI002735233D|nr:hypothetical protein [Pseudomonas sp.]MDP3816202.1 hypothetical protein [Pseudomonas sp.]